MVVSKVKEMKTMLDEGRINNLKLDWRALQVSFFGKFRARKVSPSSHLSQGRGVAACQCLQSLNLKNRQLERSCELSMYARSYVSIKRSCNNLKADLVPAQAIVPCEYSCFSSKPEVGSRMTLVLGGISALSEHVISAI
jgi:hypothetical protein